MQTVSARDAQLIKLALRRIVRTKEQLACRLQITPRRLEIYLAGMIPLPSALRATLAELIAVPPRKLR
jgi:hypothetical protein